MLNGTPFSHPWTPLLVLLTTLWLPGAAVAGETYPTDQCVARKLHAAALACQQVFRTHARGVHPRHHRAFDDALERSARLLDRRWERAEGEAAQQGVDCAETTASATDLSDLLEEGIASIADGIDDGGAKGRGRGHGRGQVCERSLLNASAMACGRLLRAEGRHLANRAWDRERVRYQAAHARIDDWLERRMRSIGAQLCSDPGAGDGLEDAVLELVDAIAAAVTVSPNVPEIWTQIDPAPVEYGGRSLAPICSGGTPYTFFARRGSVNKLMVYYQGGGACWNQLTCGGIPQIGFGPTFKQTAGSGDNPAGFPFGIFDLSNPDNPVRDWNLVFVPYCTGDIHWGTQTFDHDGVVIEHKGFVNAQVVEKWAREHFVNPDQVFVTGSSAGAYGAILNSVHMQENVYPSADFAVIGDAGNGVITRDFLVEDISTWGLETDFTSLPAWIPDLNKPLSELDAAGLYAAPAEFYPSHEFATYTTAYDGGLGGQTGFFNIMQNRTNPLEWFTWWNASCAWNDEMEALNRDAADRAPNFHFYVGAGSRHTVMIRDKLYTDQSGGESEPPIEFVRKMIDDDPDWDDVHCRECDMTLPGDPAPSPPEPPFTAGGGIVCP